MQLSQAPGEGRQDLTYSIEGHVGIVEKNGLVLPILPAVSHIFPFCSSRLNTYLLGRITGIGCPKENLFRFLQELTGWPPMDSVI